MAIGIPLLLLFAFSAGSYWLARRKLARTASGVRTHSRPGHYGLFVALWVGVPAAILLLLTAAFGPRVEHTLLTADAPAVIQQLPPELAEVFYRDVRSLAHGQAPAGAYSGPQAQALQSEAAQARRLRQTFQLGTFGLAAALALLALALTYTRVSPAFRARNQVEGWIGMALIAGSVIAVLTTIGIIASLLFEAFRFFQAVPATEFLFGTRWDPQIAMRTDQVASSGAFGALPLFAGTFLVMLIAMAVAAPVGLFSAIYLSEYAGPRVRAVVKPLLEILAGVPTVVYGFFAALTVGPLFRSFFNGIGAQLDGGAFDGLAQYLMQVQNQMALTAGVVMGIMLIPFVSSLSDDIINAVPQSMRDGSYAMGATPSETIKKVVLPAALPGIAGALLLAVSRAIGETMIVTMAAGLQAKLTVNPLDTVTTVTVQIVTLLTGDQEFDSPKTLAAFGLGLTLFLVTLSLNVVALKVVQKYREQYD